MENKKIKWILYGLGLIFNIVAIICLAAPFIKLGSYDLSGFDLVQVGIKGLESQEDVELLKVLFCILPCIITVFSLFSSIGQPIFEYLRDIGKLRKKERNTNLVLIIIGVIVSFVPFIIYLFLPKIIGLDEIVFAKIGFGAISSGLLLAFGSISSIFATVDFSKLKSSY